MRYTTTAILLAAAALSSTTTEAFITTSPSSSSSVIVVTASSPKSTTTSSSALHALDPVTYLRTEWISAALATNQTPRSADIALQLGSEDGRIVNFVPRTIRKIITSSAEPIDTTSNRNGDSNERPLTVSCERQLKQQSERRNTATIQYSNQPADNLYDTPDASVDVVLSFQAAQRMYENGLDFKRSIVEAGRVLKPGGRFLFVESAEVGGESYLEYIMGMSGLVSGGMGEEYSETELVVRTNNDRSSSETQDDEESEEDIPPPPPLFEEVGYDNVDMVLQPHIAGIAIKAMDADMTVEERKQMKSQEEEDRLAEMSFAAFERGNKRRKRKKKKTKSSTVDKSGMGMGSD